jgi:5-methylcytosine-specific restriction endonuclease McrA
MEELTGKHVDYLNKVINNKQKKRRTVLEKIKPYITSRYAKYQSKKSTLEDINASEIPLDVPSDKINKKYSLIHMYDSQEQYAREYLKEMKELLKEGIICPYCGLTESKQIDHFLPKSKFPEFSLYLPNMIVICSDCNKSKDNIAIDTTTNTRYVLHPYHDLDIYKYDFIECEIIPPYEASKFKIKICDDLTSTQKMLCLEHIKTVEIEKKIITLWRNYFDELSRRLKKNYKKNKNKYTDKEMMENFKEIIIDEIDTKNIEKNIIHKSLFLGCANNQALLKYWLTIFKD